MPASIINLPSNSTPMRDITVGTADSNGNILLSFPPAPQTFAKVGTVVSVDSSPKQFVMGSNVSPNQPLAQWIAYVGGMGTSLTPSTLQEAIPVGTFFGGSMIGPLTCNSGERLILQGSSLTPNQQYRLSYVGYLVPERENIPIFPIPNPTAGFATTMNEVIAGPQPVSATVSRNAVPSGQAMVVLPPTTGPTHAWRLFYLMVMAISNTSSATIAVAGSTQGGTNGTVFTPGGGTFTQAFPTSANEVFEFDEVFTILTQPSIATPAPLILTPAGIVMLGGVGLCAFNNTSQTQTVVVNIAYSLDH